MSTLDITWLQGCWEFCAILDWDFYAINLVSAALQISREHAKCWWNTRTRVHVSRVVCGSCVCACTCVCLCTWARLTEQTGKWRSRLILSEQEGRFLDMSHGTHRPHHWSRVLLWWGRRGALGSWQKQRVDTASVAAFVVNCPLSLTQETRVSTSPVKPAALLFTL